MLAVIAHDRRWVKRQTYLGWSSFCLLRLLEDSEELRGWGDMMRIKMDFALSTGQRALEVAR